MTDLNTQTDGILATEETPSTAGTAVTSQPSYFEDLSLDDIEPYSFEPAEITPVSADIPGYVAPDKYVPAESETTAGILTGLLDDESTYIQAAKKAGERTAQSRGLLSSSLAAEASEKAAIESALPIAQQDAQTYAQAGLLAQEGAQQGALSTQQLEGQAELYNLQTQLSQQLQANELSQQDYNTQRAAIYQGFIESGLSAQDAEEAIAQAEREAELTSELSAQEAGQQMEIETMAQEYANYRAELEDTLKRDLTAAELAAEEKIAFGNQMAAYGEIYQQSIDATMRDPNVPAESKTIYMQQAQEAYQASVTSLANIYEIEIDWGSYVPASTTTTEPTTETTAGTTTTPAPAPTTIADIDPEKAYSDMTFDERRIYDEARGVYWLKDAEGNYIDPYTQQFGV